MSQRVRIYTAEDVASHKDLKSCWLSRNGKVYDVTSFLPDHPGGEDLILQHAGQGVEEIMKDASEHEHSDSAYDMLEEFIIGRLGNGETLVSDDWEATDDFHPDETDTAKDFEKNEFLDLRKPLLKQVWQARWSKAYYLQQVHQPRHLHESARLFGPAYLEVFTKTSWYVVPTIWLPITGYLFLRCILQFTLGAHALPPFSKDFLAPFRLIMTTEIPTSAWVPAGICVFFGMVIWTLLEYFLHRFLFHIDEMMPDHQYALTLHFLLHGVHHYLPMDKLRLVMPPVMFTILSYPFTQLAHLLFPSFVANGLITGAYSFYVLYDVMHYALHHSRLPAYMREMKNYHLAHHYKNFELGFGVTSKIWDYVFNTVLTV
ncbi:fatty acid alpha-hydroxylase [Steccherinum ochraceum]|uniref:Ceramide very long chain fatty acid hydroxylase n=1 Tax=Steccherinum ochraceum TaxID=92696 RepID=A0A4R0RHI7_9APHY|nr:fatty acid alpha-hydroxylase [Steccherinum ochraceum]